MGKAGKKAHNKPRGERKDDLERKRDERAKRSALKKEKQARAYYSFEYDENYVSFCNQLQAVGLKIKEIPGDGNCLFRSLADQLEGDHNRHAALRKSTIQFMRENSIDFEPFHDGETTFNEYLEELGKDGTFAGNDVIVAFARNNNVDIVIHQHSSPRFIINAPENPNNIQLHLAYHNGEHYSSLRRIHDTSNGPAYLENNGQSCTLNQHFKATESAALKTSYSKKSQEKHAEKAEDSSRISEVEKRVIESTNCRNHLLVKQTLEENGQDFDTAVAYILQLMSLDEQNDAHNTQVNKEGLESEIISKYEKDKDETEDEQNKQNKSRHRNNQKPAHLSNRQRKELAKQAKKKRRIEEQKDQLKNDINNAIKSQQVNCDVRTVAI